MEGVDDTDHLADTIISYLSHEWKVIFVQRM